MTARHSSKQSSKVLVAALLVNLGLIIGLVLYFTVANTPKRFSQLVPEAREATMCSIVSPGWSSSLTLTGEGLEEFLDRLEQSPYYRTLGNSPMTGNEFYHISFLVGDTWSTQSLTLSDTGKLSVGSRQYATKDGGFTLSIANPAG